MPEFIYIVAVPNCCPITLQYCCRYSATAGLEMTLETYYKIYQILPIVQVAILFIERRRVTCFTEHFRWKTREILNKNITLQ